MTTILLAFIALLLCKLQEPEAATGIAISSLLTSPLLCHL